MFQQSLRMSPIQKTTTDTKTSTEQKQLQRLVVSQTHRLEKIVRLELDNNPALKVETEPFDLEDRAINVNDRQLWNQDYDKPYDEYETGDSLKGAVGLDWAENEIASSLEQSALENFGGDQEKLKSALEQIEGYRQSGSWSDYEDNDLLHEDFRILQKSISYSTLKANQTDI